MLAACNAIRAAPTDKFRATSNGVLGTHRLLIDNPGMREVGLWEAEDGVSDTFDDVASRAGNCRFDDCRHDCEPGCAVQAAVQQGELGQERLASFHKLASELRRPR